MTNVISGGSGEHVHLRNTQGLAAHYHTMKFEEDEDSGQIKV